MAEPEISADAGQTEEPVVMDDPNKMMSPDDIAALLAGMQSERSRHQSRKLKFSRNRH